MAYARRTAVSIDRSKSEIEKILGRYGAHEFAYMTKGDMAVVLFAVHGKRVRFNLPLPDKNEFAASPSGRRRRDTGAMFKAWERACRERWRALALIIKAKLEAVESGITIFDEEFLAHLVMVGGKTVGERLLPEISDTLKKAAGQPLLPA